MAALASREVTREGKQVPWLTFLAASPHVSFACWLHVVVYCLITEALGLCQEETGCLLSFRKNEIRQIHSLLSLFSFLS